MSAGSSERLHALDAVRGFALIAGIVFHATVSFLPTPASQAVWIVMDSHRSLSLAAVFHLLHTFRMTTFFLIAGFFAHLTFHRRGARGFIVDRLKRIGIPLVVGWPFLMAAIIAVTIWAAIQTAHGGPLPPAPKYPGFPAFPLTHLWFLYLLLIFYAAILALSAVAGALDRTGRLARVADRGVGFLAGHPLGVVLLAAPAGLALALTPDWIAWFGVPTPDSSLVPNAAASAAYFTAFAFGWLLHRRVDLLDVLRRRWPVNLAAGVACSLAGFGIVGVAPLLHPLTGWPRIAFATVYCVAAWSWSFALIGLALRFLADLSPVRRYIADASYWLYIVHLPLVMALQTWVAPLSWPWSVKFAVVLGVALPLMLGSYELLVRHSFIGAILNGRRIPWTRRDATDLLAAADSRQAGA
jgi:peptidoglycan/LPS O-acetylase OafA/YrhL